MAQLWYNAAMILGKDNIERLPSVGTSDGAAFSRGSYCAEKSGLACFKNAVEICRILRKG